MSEETQLKFNLLVNPNGGIRRTKKGFLFPSFNRPSSIPSQTDSYKGTGTGTLFVSSGHPLYMIWDSKKGYDSKKGT